MSRKKQGIDLELWVYNVHKYDKCMGEGNFCPTTNSFIKIALPLHHDKIFRCFSWFFSNKILLSSSFYLPWSAFVFAPFIAAWLWAPNASLSFARYCLIFHFYLQLIPTRSIIKISSANLFLSCEWITLLSALKTDWNIANWKKEKNIRRWVANGKYNSSSWETVTYFLSYTCTHKPIVYTPITMPPPSHSYYNRIH